MQLISDVIGFMSDLDQKLAQRIREVREEQSLSQGDLAKRMRERGLEGFQQQTVARIESGNRKVTFGEAIALATALNHTPEGLLGEDGEEALVQRGANVARTASALSRAAQDYTVALFDFVLQADAIQGPIREGQQSFLEAVYRAQTPAMMTVDSGLAINAAMSRRGITEPGPYLERLIEAVARDESALEAASTDPSDG